jgi:LysR family transcriptional regulator, glycine cleavage system transcriptional activator
MRLPPLDALRVFEAAARHGSFAKAAAELNLTASAVSHRIAALEGQLGTALFERHGRRVRPTAPGAAYAAAVGEALAGLKAATDRFAAARGGGALTISVAPLFAMRWLLPRLSRFEARHPDVVVRIASSIGTTDFAVEDIDAVVRFGRGPWPGLAAHFLFVMDLVPVCAPALAKGPPPLKRPADLARVTRLHSETMPDVWAMWLKLAGIDGLAAAERHFQDTTLAIEAAFAGLGVAMTDRRFVAADLAAGRLTAPFEVRLHTRSAFYFAYPETRAADPRIAAFRDWIVAEAATEGDAPAPNGKTPLRRARTRLSSPSGEGRRRPKAA